MDLGFCGTRTLPYNDRPFIHSIIGASTNLMGPQRVITGACIGIDDYVAYICRNRLLVPVHSIIPADRSRVALDWKANCDTFEEMPEGTNYKDRNQRIVNLSDALIAFPSHTEDHPASQRSGTWQTIRMAQRKGIPVYIYVLN